jgi:hypothetical protein
MRPVGASLAALLFSGSLLAGQTPNNSDRVQELEREVEAARHRLMDWAGLTRYGG